MSSQEYQTESFLVQYNASALHVYLDIGFETAENAVKMYRGVVVNFGEQLQYYPERKAYLEREIKKVRAQVVASLIAISQKHGEILLDETARS